MRWWSLLCRCLSVLLWANSYTSDNSRWWQVGLLWWCSVMAATCRTMTAFSLGCNMLTTRGRCKLDGWWAAYMQNHLRVHQSAPHQNYYEPKFELCASFLRTPKKKKKSIDEIFLLFIFFSNHSKIRFVVLNLLFWIKYKISFRARNSPHHYLNSIDFKLYNRAKILHAGHS